SVIISQLRKEQDESVASILAYNIPRETRFADGAAAVLQEQKSQNVRLVVGDVLADTPGDDVTKALAKLASTEADPTVKRLLELGLESRKQQPVSGFFLTYVAPKSQGETVGLRDGDIITTYNGVRIRAFEDLWKLNMKYTDTVPIVIYRAGATQQLTVTGTLQALGVLGRMVHSD
ncbi:hypothetical protein HY251_14440, partial [bacterium]|nr:hypothetical protein [bacterium]